MRTKTRVDAIIIGGSYAGLSAAMALGRSLRKVLIIDGGKPCNRQTPYSHNFITQDGVKPQDISQQAKEQVLRYNTVEFLEDLAISGEKTPEGFKINTQSGKAFLAKKLIFATGIKDMMPDIKGFAECWGISVVHCPYCHGYEIRNKKTAIYAEVSRAMHLAALVKNLTDDLTLIVPDLANFNEEEREKLHRHGIALMDTPISAIAHEQGHLQYLIGSEGQHYSFEALYAALPFQQHSDIPEALGCELTEHGHIAVDSFQKTSIPGVYACGDNSTMMRSVASAVYSGNVTGAMVNTELVKEDF